MKADRWGAVPRLREVRWIFLHTAGTPDGGDVSAAAIDTYHRAPTPRGRGWAGIGYHWVVRKDGTVEAGRPMTRQGAQVEGMNAVSLGVCLSGNHDLHPMTQAQEAAVLPLLAKLCAAFDLDADKVRGHREVNQLVDAGEAPKRTTKSCPGTRVSMDAVRAALALRLPPPTPPDVSVVPLHPSALSSLRVDDAA